MLAGTLIFSVSGFASETEIDPTINDFLTQPFFYEPPPPIPGDMTYPYPVHDVPDYLERISDPPELGEVSRNDIVIDIIEQVDEQLLLGYLEGLVAFGPRETETPACEQAGDWIYDQFQSMGLDVRYHSWNNSGYTGENIEATLPGTDPASDEIYIICGHHDSVAGSPGADDDGSGTVATIAAAYILSQYSFDHTIRFVTFSGEEQGLLGSERYVQDAYGNGDDIVATLNVDMIGFAEDEFEGSKVKVYHNDYSYWLVDYTDDIATQYEDLIDLDVLPSGWSWGSDHYYFWEYDYDALFYHEYEFNHYYHSPQDTIEHMNLTYDMKCTRLILATLATLSNPGGSSNPPDTPDQPDGPTEGDAYTEYTFSTSTTDPESDQICYKWDWGDEISDWEGPYASGETVESTHYWREEGTYEISVKAKDDNGSISSDWSEPIEIDIAGIPKVDIVIQGGLGVKATLTNQVDIDLEDLLWNISFDGGIILVEEGTSGIIENLPIGESEIIQTDKLFGIGLPLITVAVDDVEVTVRGLLFGPLVLIIG